MSKPPLSYQAAGVDIDAGEQLVARIKPHAARTHNASVLGGLGGFGALFELPQQQYRQPVMVSATDGVGTKLLLALSAGCYNSIGIDLVAMCANDIVVAGAEPLFFLDYYASGKLDVEAASEVIAGIADGCEQAGAALIGGETAEMPGVYQNTDFDLAGFCVGIVEKERIIDGQRIQAGDCLLGLASSGPHANGFSLIRQVLARSGVASTLQQPFTTDTTKPASFADVLLAPTRIYVKPLLQLIAAVEVHALAHITGGGITDNLPRVLPEGLGAVIDTTSWSWPKLFTWLQQQGQISTEDMRRTFNCGVGMIVCVPSETADQALSILHAAGETAWRIGCIEIDSTNAHSVRFV